PNLYNSNWQITGANSGSVFGLTFTNFGSLVGGNVVDFFHLAPTASLSVGITGGSGDEYIYGPNQNNTWNLTGTNTGTLGSVSWTNVPNLVGGAANDKFVFANGANITGKLLGNPGTNTADYLDHAADGEHGE